MKYRIITGERGALHQIRISHDKNLVRHDRCQLHVVGYENQRKTKLLLQVYNFINDFLPQRQVKSIGGLVKDQALRLSGQCPGDCHSLLFSTGQL